jgi:hypothetical protein
MALLTALLFSACGDGAVTATPSADPAPVPLRTARFVDAPTGGLHYQCGSQSGVTQPDGSFDVEPGATCTFSIGGLVLGSSDIPADGIVTPYELADVPRANAGDRKAVAIAQLLQSVATTTPQGLQVDDTVQTALNDLHEDLVRSDGTLVTQAELAALVSTAARGGRALLAPSTASDAMDGYIESSGIDKSAGRRSGQAVTRVLYVARAGGIDVYTISNYQIGFTAALDIGRPDATPLGIVVARELHLAFVFENAADGASGLIHSVQINPASGALTALGKTAETPAWVLAAQYDPYQRVIYTIPLNDFSIRTDKPWIMRHRIQADASLSAGEMAFDRHASGLAGTELQDFVLDPFGRAIYATNWTAGLAPTTNLLPLQIGANGALTLDPSAVSTVDGVVQGVGGGFGTPNGRLLFNIVDTTTVGAGRFRLMRQTIDDAGQLVANGTPASTSQRPCSSLASSSDGRVMYYRVGSGVTVVDTRSEPLALQTRTGGGPLPGATLTEWCAMAKAPGDDHFVVQVGNAIEVFKIGADGLPEFKSFVIHRESLAGQFVRLSAPLGYY